jgi:hypothetical protein
VTDQQAATDPNVELPPPIQKLIASIRADRKTLLKDKAYENPAQLRQFIGQFLLPRMVEIVEMLGETYVDNVNIGLGNQSTIRSLHAWARRHFESLDIDADDELPGAPTELLSQIGQALHALGAVLATKLPDDEEAGVAFNTVVALFTRLSQELMGDDEDDGGDDDEGDGEPEGEGNEDETAESDDAPSDAPQE